MQMSARILGNEYGLTGEEMNRALLKLGFLEGVPGDYCPTEKARQYVVEKDFHRGTGGYAHYNRYWTTKTYDDSIKEVLDISPELIREVRDELAAVRAERSAARAIERAKDEAEFLAKQASEQAALEVEECAAMEKEELIAKLKTAGEVCFIIVGVVGVVYFFYKITPEIKKWWNNRKSSIETSTDESLSEDT